MRATALLKNYRGLIARQNRIMTFVLVGVGALCALVAVLVGFFIESWFWCMFLIILYIVGLFIAQHLIKQRQSKALRSSQFLLAIFCRAENNKLYLKHNVEIRPGYLAKWIEINFIQLNEHPNTLSYLRSRFLKSSID